MKYSDFSRSMPLGAAVEALMQRGLSEEEAKPFLLAAIADGLKLNPRDRPISLSGLASEPAATDWQR